MNDADLKTLARRGLNSNDAVARCTLLGYLVIEPPRLRTGKWGRVPAHVRERRVTGVLLGEREMDKFTIYVAGEPRRHVKSPRAEPLLITVLGTHSGLPNRLACVAKTTGTQFPCSARGLTGSARTQRIGLPVRHALQVWKASVL